MFFNDKIKKIYIKTRNQSLLSSELPEDIKKKIRTWLIEEYPTLEIESISNSNAFFHLKIRNNKAGAAALPTNIIMINDLPDRIFINFNWQLHEQQIKSINALKPEAKKKLQKQLNIGFLLMYLNFIPKPNIQDIQKIIVEDQIILDGLNKHTLIKALQKINCTYGYILSQFDLILDQGFDPYRQL